MVRIRPEWDEDARQLALAFPDGTRVEGVVELGEAVDADMYGIPASVAPRRRSLGAGDLGLRRPAADTPLGGHVRGRPRVSRAAPSRSSPADRSSGCARRAVPTKPLTAAGSACSSRSTASARTRRTTGSARRCGSATRRSPERRRRALRRHVARSRHAASPTSTRSAPWRRYRREGRNEPLPFGVYGTSSVPGRVRVGDPVQPLQERLLSAT